MPSPTFICARCSSTNDSCPQLHLWSITADRHVLCPICTRTPARHRCPTCGIPFYNPPSSENPCRICNAPSSSATHHPTYTTVPPPTANHPWYPSICHLRFPGGASPILASTRLIGLEIEALHPNSSRPQALSRFGILKPDGSLRRSPDNQASYCFELATWATSGHLLINFLSDLCSTLRSEAVEVNSTCGLHIHIDMSSSTQQQRTNLAFWWAIFEDLFFAIQPPARRAGLYAKPASIYRSLAEWRAARYSALNLQAFDRHKTFEWRLGAGTVEHRDILLQVQLILAFVAAFEDRLPYSGPDDPDYLALLALDDRAFLSHFLKCLTLPTSAIKGLLRRIRTHNSNLLQPSYSDRPAEHLDTDIPDDNDADDDDHYDDDDEASPTTPAPPCTIYPNP